MDSILYLLLPLSIAFVILIGAVLCWAVLSGQFENADKASHSILDDPD